MQWWQIIVTEILLIYHLTKIMAFDTLRSIRIAFHFLGFTWEGGDWYITHF